MLQKPFHAVFLLALCLFFGIAAPSSATTVERLTLEDMTSRAGIIVQGTVRSSRTFWTADRKLILTTTTFEVTERLKGQPSKSIELTTIGGQIGDTILHVAGMPAFHDGESAIVFVERSGAYQTLVGLGQGKFSVENGEVSNAVSDLSFPDGKPARSLKLSLETFKNRVRSILDRQR
jgi:hypothetical protein